MERTRKLLLARARPGMVLAEPVCGSDDQVLLPARTQLTSDNIEMLRQRKVELTTVFEAAQDEVSEPVQLDEATLRKIIVTEHAWFGDTRDNEIMAEFFRCAVNRAARMHPNSQ